jgi:hypothetical protein
MIGNISEIEIFSIENGIVEFGLGEEVCNVQIEEQEVWEEEPHSFNGFNDEITYDLHKHIYRVTIMKTLECGLYNIKRKEEICAQLNKMLND